MEEVERPDDVCRGIEVYVQTSRSAALVFVLAPPHVTAGRQIKKGTSCERQDGGKNRRKKQETSLPKNAGMNRKDSVTSVSLVSRDTPIWRAAVFPLDGRCCFARLRWVHPGLALPPYCTRNMAPPVPNFHLPFVCCQRGGGGSDITPSSVRPLFFLFGKPIIQALSSTESSDTEDASSLIASRTWPCFNFLLFGARTALPQIEI